MSTERVLVHESKMSELESEILAQWHHVEDKPFDVVRGESVKDVKKMVDEAVESVGSLTYFKMVQTLNLTKSLGS